MLTRQQFKLDCCSLVSILNISGEFVACGNTKTIQTLWRKIALEHEEDLSRGVRRTRQALKTAFVDLILEKGYEAVTIMDIAIRADYNRGTFYKHFVSKEDLLRDIHDDFLRNISELLLQPYEGMEKIDAAGVILPAAAFPAH